MSAKRYACCACCESVAKDDHVGYGGFIEKDGHDGPCDTCEFREHVRPLLADAWDHGFEAGWAAQDPDDHSPNPYRLTPPDSEQAR